MNTDTADTHGTIWSYDTGERVRAATEAEEMQARVAAIVSRGATPLEFIDDGRAVYWD